MKKDNKGWICDKCSRSFAPNVEECKYCNKDINDKHEEWFYISNGFSFKMSDMGWEKISTTGYKYPIK